MAGSALMSEGEMLNVWRWLWGMPIVKLLVSPSTLSPSGVAVFIHPRFYIVWEFLSGEMG